MDAPEMEILESLQNNEEKFGQQDKEGVGIKTILFILELIAIVLIVFFILRLFVLQPYTVIGSSMIPTLFEGEEVYVNTLSYKFKDPQRGDIVVLVPPINTGKNYVKRIIGLPGERLQIKGDGQVIIFNDEYPSGIALAENYLKKEFSTKGYVVETLGPDEYFVMGDNREASSDSRGNINQENLGAGTDWTLPKRNIVGKVIFRTKPSDKLTLFKSPSYNL